MKIAMGARTKKEFEPFYADILELSKKKKITLSAARKELIRNANKNLNKH